MEKPVFLKPFRRPLLLEKYTLKMHMANEGEKNLFSFVTVQLKLFSRSNSEVP